MMPTHDESRALVEGLTGYLPGPWNGHDKVPQCIWLLPFDGEQRCWCGDPDPGGHGLESEATAYVRADLVEHLTAALDREAAAEAENARLREALERIATAAGHWSRHQYSDDALRYAHETTARLANAALAQTDPAP